ncbi:MAG: ATP-grasp domain-containing protein [Phycisphaerales bacterium]
MINDPVLHIHSLQSKYLGDGLSDGLGSAILKDLSLRSILLANAQDEVIVSKVPDPDWIRYLSTTGIELPAITVPDGTGDTLVELIRSDKILYERLLQKSDPILPYMGGDQIDQLAADLSRDLLSPSAPLLERLNLKSNLNPILESLRIPTIHTQIVDHEVVVEMAKEAMNTLGPLLIRSDLSIGGHGVWKIESKTDLNRVSDGAQQATDGRLFLIQPLFTVTDSPNVQFFIGDSGPEYLGMSAQQMTPSFAFGGNDFPSPMQDHESIDSQASSLASWLYESEYRGFIGIDFIVTQDKQVFIVEINPRVNTSSFPLLLAKRLQRKAFRLLTGLRVSGHSFDDLVNSVGSDLLYSPRKASGMIPLMVPSASRPMLDAMVFADDPVEVDNIAEELQDRIMGVERVGVLGEH